ncbi:MAG: PQQ-binding-like beta-propeller repeat protein, partial [Pantoea agglomerans]
MGKNSSSFGVIRFLTVLFAALTGAFMLIGGGWLAAIGGSWYYVFGGVVMLITAYLLSRRKSTALVLYALLLIGTLIWGVWEVGTDFWALAPRTDVLVIFGVWLILPFVYRSFNAGSKAALGTMAVALIASAIVLAYAVFNDPQVINGSVPETADNAPQAAPLSNIPDADWPAYARDQQGTRFSPLKQINHQNVKELQVAWQFQTGDMKTPNDPGEITDEVTPIKIRDTLYLCSPHQILFALDAATGKQKWKFDPGMKVNPTFQHVTCRGVSYHEVPAAADAANTQPALCSRRIYLPVNDGRLFALDAETGERCPAFGVNGELDLQHKQPVTTAGQYEPTSPPVITNTTIVMAGAVTDNYSTREPSGVIRGFDVNTGKLLWVFDPGAKDPNAIPADEHTFTMNSPNSWAPAVYDPKLDTVYLPMGVSTPDIWGGNRTPEQERYASSVLALNATTGKLVWSYQTVHH